MSGYLLDTCIISKWYAKRPGITARMDSLPGASQLYISVISRGEIEFGHTYETSLPAQQAAFRKWLREEFADRELCISTYAGEQYGDCKRRLFEKFDKKGKYSECREDKLGQKCGIDENDLWLAAQACEKNLILITTDEMAKIKEVMDDPGRIWTWPDD